MPTVTFRHRLPNVTAPMRSILLLVLLSTIALPLPAQRAVPGRPPRDETRYDDLFRKYSKRFFGVGYDWRYFKAQGMTESNLDSAARSYVGARGIMQLMPSTFAHIQSRRTEFESIDHVEWNIAAGILHDRYLWQRWKELGIDDERRRFMFGSYNAGEGPILRARGMARQRQLDAHAWSSIEEVAPDVRRWRYRETLGYVRKIQRNHRQLTERERARSRLVRIPEDSANQGQPR
jgi:membrane-bound lytic murein transglycosylase F